MTEDEFKEALEELDVMLNQLHRIKDKNLTLWLKRDIRRQLQKILSVY